MKLLVSRPPVTSHTKRDGCNAFTLTYTYFLLLIAPLFFLMSNIDFNVIFANMLSVSYLNIKIHRSIKLYGMYCQVAEAFVVFQLQLTMKYSTMSA